MTVRIFVKTPVPRRIALVVTCDRRNDLLPCAAEAEFDVTDGIPRDHAIRAGWRFDKDGPVFCPSCKGIKE